LSSSHAPSTSEHALTQIQDAPAHGGPEGAHSILEKIRAGEIETVVVGGCDMNGVFRAKRMPAQRFGASDEPYVEFSEYMWAMDIDEYAQPRPADFKGWWPEWSTGFGDVEAVADLNSLRRVPWLDHTAIAVSNYRFPDGRPYDIAPRNVLCRVIERYERLGLEPRMAPEFEFFVFRETEQSAEAKRFRDLEPLSPRAMAYGGWRATLDDHLIGRMARALAEMRVPIDTWAPEGGPGQYELNLPHAEALEAADQGFLFKHGVKEFCGLNGMLATFVPKLAAGGFGSSLHVHQSVWQDGEPIFYDDNSPDRMSKTMQHYVAGQLQTLIALAPIWLPTPLSFKRPRAYLAAGTTESWGYDNKTLSLRVVAYEAGHCRVEHRVPGADANVYLALAAMLAGGLYGIENELELPPAIDGDAYAAPGLNTLPRNLDASIGAFEQSEVANEYLGEEFVSRYAASRRWEVEQSEEEVTDWELRRYLVRC
jgi:glutamine synthetase